MFFRYCWILCVLTCALPLQAVDRIFLFPPGGTNVVNVLNADSLQPVASIPVPSAVNEAFSTPQGNKIYLIARTGTDTVIAVDPDTLAVTSRLGLNATPSDAVITPDGRYVLVAAGSLHVIDAVSDFSAATIDVGGGPTRIAVNNDASIAFVLASSGTVVSVVDLVNLGVIGNIDIQQGAGDIALTPDDSRLLVSVTNGVRQYRTTDYSFINEIAGRFLLTNADLRVTPDSERVLAVNQGRSPNTNSLIFYLEEQASETIGQIGTDTFRDIVVVDDEIAYGIDRENGDLHKINLALRAPSVEAIEFAKGGRALDLSPNRTILTFSSLPNSSVTLLDTQTGNEILTQNVVIAPAGHATVYEPSREPPAEIQILGGNNQFVPPNAEAPRPLSVRVVDANGNPLVGVPVFFDAQGEVDANFLTPFPVLSNARGIATTKLRTGDAELIPTALPTEPSKKPEALDGTIQDHLSRYTSTARKSFAAAEGHPRRQGETPILSPINIGVRAGSLPVTIMQLNVILSSGLIAVSGDFQVTTPNTPFPKPFVMLATDLQGKPLPAGTRVDIVVSNASCNSPLFTDPNGFADVICRGKAQLASSSGLFEDGIVTASIPDFLGLLGNELAFTSFRVSTAPGAAFMEIQTRAGDNQTVPAGERLPTDLEFVLSSQGGGSFFSSITGRGVGLNIRQVSGPPATIEPNFVVTLPNIRRSAAVTLGPNAGIVRIEVEALTTNLPKTVFTVSATGGLPAQMNRLNDNQSGPVGTELANPLRVQVIDESGSVVAFPQVQWAVLEGEATIVTSTDETGSSARVLFGNTPGQIRVQASLGALVQVFTVNAIPSQPVAIANVAGQNQTLSVGQTSTPLVVRVTEANNAPAPGVLVTYSGPSNIRFFPPGGGAPANPLAVATQPNGEASATAEVLRGVDSLLPGGARGQFANSITISASVGGQLSTTFVINLIGETPEFTAAGVVSAATFAQQPGLSPGGLATVFGTSLSDGPDGAFPVGGATSFEGTTVRIGGVPAPILSIARGVTDQLNVQAPFETPSGQTTSVEIENNGSRRTVGGIPVFGAQPGIFEIPVGGGENGGAVIHLDGAIVSPTNPAQKGEALSLFFTGGGRLNPPAQTGVPIVAPPIPVIVQDVVIGVDNKGAEPLFAGYAPGFLGLYQANFFVPEDAECGEVPLNVRVGDVFSPISRIWIDCAP